MAALRVSGDGGAGKTLVLAGVPASRAGALPAGEWAKSALAVLGGKGGGKPTLAQGQGGAPDKLPEALEAAAAFALAKLSL